MKKSENLFKKIQILAFFLLVFCALAIGYKFDFKPQNIINLSSGNIFITIFLILLVYALKSIVMFMPVIPIYIAVGALFPNVITAMFINILGVTISLSVGYLNGKILGSKKLHDMYEKYPNLQKINELQTSNCMFFSFLTRTFGFLPCDVVSIYFGAKQLPFIPYIIGAVAGMIPGLILISIMGTNIDDPTSIGFISPLFINIAISFISVLLYKHHKKNSGSKK